jgi:DNA-binding protein H-NS
MTKVDLSNYDVRGLRELQRDLEKEIKERQQQEIKKAHDKILAIAQDVGIPLERLVATATTKKTGSKTKVAAQYRNPTDSSQTWAGRGRQPRWIAEALQGGKTLDELRI